MKAVLAVALALTAAASLRADWAELQPGMDAPAALKCIGTPIMASHGVLASSIWTYDSGGFVLFANGRVSYWERPKQKEPVVQSKTQAQVRVTPAPKPAARKNPVVVASS